MTPDAAIDAGIYNVPRSLMQSDDSRMPTSEDDPQYLLGANPFDIYDYPRVSMSPDEEGIYDDPLDIVDMEIYDYPPDASELGLEDVNLNMLPESSRTSMSTVSGEYPQNDRGNLDSSIVPPLPISARPSAILSAEPVDSHQVYQHNH